MEQTNKRPLVILTGPTAVGKTAASIGPISIYLDTAVKRKTSQVKNGTTPARSIMLAIARGLGMSKR